MTTFIALYLAPTSVLDDWMKIPEEERKGEETKMQTEWNAWMEENKGLLKETRSVGTVKRITQNGIEDTRNDVMMYSIVEAETQDAAAEIFKGHPHLQIPQSSIEVMSANLIPGT